MNLVIVGPLAVATAGAAVMGIIASRVEPHQSARLCSLSILSVLGASWATSTALTLAYLAHLPIAGGRFVWCRQALGMHQPPPALVGIAALVVTTLGAMRLSQLLRRWHRERGTKPGHVHILSSDRAFAFAQPGPRGGIIVSSTMIAALRPGEHRAVLAHEQSHLQHRHDRYLLLATLSDQLPGLTRVAGELRLAVERWADEDAASAVGDRRLVARAVARAALASSPPPKRRLAVTGSNVPTRVLALTSPTAYARSWTALAMGLGLAGLLAAAIQLHHLIPVLATLARH